MASPPSTPRVLVVADDLLARAGLAALLSTQPGCTVVGQVPAKAGLAPDLEVYQPDVLLWDLGWDPAQSIEPLAELPDSSPPVVALLADKTHAVQVWNIGIRCILLRDSDAPAMVAALVAAAQGLAVFAPEVATTLTSTAESFTPPLSEGLTPREFQVLRLLAEGLPNKSIARRLGISEHTVKFHVNAILGKLGAQSRTEAVTVATRLGLISL